MATNIVVPELGESVVEATVGTWYKAVGEPVSVGEVLVELQTDKVDQEISADVAGVLTSIAHPEGADVNIGDVLGVIGDGDGDGDSAEAVSSAVEPPADAKPATPVARRIAEAEGVDLTAVAGSGRGGRVTKQDVVARVGGDVPAAVQVTREAHAAPAATPAPAQSAPVARPRPQADALALPTLASDGRSEERSKMSRRRRTIARRLVEVQQTAAILTTFNEIDMGAVIDLRTRWKQKFLDQQGVKLGFTSFFTKAVVGALKAFPHVNAEIDGDEMIVKHYYDIGIAVGAEQGLVVPVLRDADRMSFAEIESQVRAFSAKARDGSLSLSDLMGGTFTITNGGVFGSMLSTPILNPPQVGILGLHNIVERPVAVNGEVVIRPIMYVALSYDHRIVDGREAVQFLVRVKELIEDPEQLLLAG
jgi:2-oxoglutarate dehydrogenase E2 component (dihydrolipoamide succinyltransferase)